MEHRLNSFWSIIFRGKPSASSRHNQVHVVIIVITEHDDMLLNGSDIIRYNERILDCPFILVATLACLVLLDYVTRMGCLRVIVGGVRNDQDCGFEFGIVHCMRRQDIQGLEITLRPMICGILYIHWYRVAQKRGFSRETPLASP